MTLRPSTPKGPSRWLHAARLLSAAGTALTCALYASVAAPAAAATFYVDNTNPACTDAGPGTAAIPYRTITAAASQHRGPGNSIMVLAGTYHEQVSIPASGASGSPFEILAASPAVTVDAADDFSAIGLWTQVSGDVWLAATVTWAPKQVFADGTRLAASTAAPASMPARTFQYVAGTGLYVNAGGGNPGGHATLVGHRPLGFTMSAKSWVNVRGFTVLHAEDKGIHVQSASSQVEITDNRVSQTFKFGIQITGSTACLVARNTSWDNGGHGFALTAGSTGCTVEDNEAYQNADPLVRNANGLHVSGSTSHIIRRNRWHHNQDTGQHMQSSANDCVSLQNRSWNNGDHGFDHLASTGTIHVGDVAYGNFKDGFSIEGNASGTQLHNCIAIENGLTTNEFDLWVDQTSALGFVSDYNLFWKSTAQPVVKYGLTLYTSVAVYSAASLQDAQTLQSNPLFVNPVAGDFHLQPGSPAIDNANSAAPNWPAADANGLQRLDDPATPNAGVGPIAFADRGALEYPPAFLALTPSSGTAPLSVLADATGSLGPNGTVASYRFDFGDGTVVGPQPGSTATHTYAAGNWTATVTVSDQSGGTNTAQATASVIAPTLQFVERRVATGSDDAEEQSNGSMLTHNKDNKDLDMVVDGGNLLTVGMRWSGIAIPRRAIITAAYVQFTARAAQSEATNLTIVGQAADNAATFTTATRNLSSRPRTAAAASWSPAPWATSEGGANQRTGDLSAVLQEIVDRPAWTSANALALIVTGSGHRTAYAYEGSQTLAPLLHVEFAEDFPPTARLALRQLPSPALTVVADASASNDPDPSPIASYRFDFGDGSAPVTTTAPVGSAQHSYAAAGTYTVTVVATDTRGNASAPTSTSITLNVPPTARLSVAQLLSPPLTVRADGSASTDTDAMPIASYRFDFGDGQPAVTSTVPTAIAQHIYAAAGTYTVTLIATDTGGLNSAPATASITVDAAPTARLAVAQLPSPALTVRADGSASTDPDATPIASYRFDFGDGTAAVSTTVPTAIAQHTYAAPGIYTVSLVVTDAGGYVSNPDTAAIIVNGAPSAALAVTQLTSPPLTVGADASASTDPDPMPIQKYRFDFGDSTPPDTTNAPTALAQHTYAAAGTYTVTVTAIDGGGLTSVATRSIALVRPPTAALTVAQLSSPPLTVRADGSASTDPDGTPIANYRFNFGDGSPEVVTTSPTAAAQHTYSAPGIYDVRMVATGSRGFESAPVIASARVAAALERRVATGSDDAEEDSNGRSVINNSDLDLVLDHGNLLTVGMRWSGIAIPPRAIITAAYVQFTARDAQSEATNLTIVGQAADNTATFTTSTRNVSSRARTAAAASWTPPTWVKNQTGTAQRTVDLSAVLQEIVNRPGWASGNALALLVTGSGHRTAYAYDGSSSLAPLLHIEYVPQDAPPPPPQDLAPTARLTVTQAPSPALTVNADASASSDTDATPIASYRFDFGDGSAAVTTTAPVASAQHTYAAAGTYTVTVRVTDTGGLTSAPASASVSVTGGSGGTTITVEQRVAASIDDAEEYVGSGTVSLTSSDLELVADGSTLQTAGMRWAGLAIPRGATIRAAYIQFSSKEAQSSVNALDLRAEASDNAASFGSATSFNITTRPRTTAAASWSPVPWLAGEVGANQRTPDLSAVIREVVNRTGWASGNALAIIVSGSGRRTAWAYDGNAAAAPLLHVEYTLGAAMPMAAQSETPVEALPGRLSLSAPRPNPAAGPVAFRLELPQRSSVRWAVYDAQGRVVWREEQVFEAGRVDLSWNGRMADGSRAGPGLYFAQVHAGDRVFDRRFVKL